MPPGSVICQKLVYTPVLMGATIGTLNSAEWPAAVGGEVTLTILDIRVPASKCQWKSEVQEAVPAFSIRQVFTK
jgi:hypothetical protein